MGSYNQGFINKLKQLERRISEGGQEAKTPIPSDFIEFCSRVKVRSGSGLSYFKLYDYQRDIFHAIERNNKIVVAKSRQMGLSELVCTYFLWLALTNPYTVGLVLSKTFRDASVLAQRIRLIASQISGYEGAGLTGDSLQSLRFENGSELLFRPSNPDAARSIASLSYALLDECAFIPDAALVYGALEPCLSMVDKPKLILVSTPNLQTDFFAEHLANGVGMNHVESTANKIDKDILPPCHIEEGDNIAKVYLHFKAHPVYGKSPKEFLSKKKALTAATDSDLKREYCLSFTSSSTGVFSPIVIRKQSTDVLIKNYKPDESNSYWLGVDPSGLGRDFTVCVVIEERHEDNTLHIVEMYRSAKNSFQADIFEISNLIDRYNPSAVTVESNGAGANYIEVLSNAMINPIYISLATTRNNKEANISRVVSLLEREILFLPEYKPLTLEMLNLQYQDGKIEGKPHDDIPMSIAIGLAGRSEFSTDHKRVIKG